MRRNHWLASVGITGWNASESPAGLRRNTQAGQGKPSLLAKGADPARVEAVATLTAKALDAVSPPEAKGPRYMRVRRTATSFPKYGNRAGTGKPVPSVDPVQAPEAGSVGNGASALRKRMESRMSGPVYTPKAAPPLQRFSPEQIDRMCRDIDLRRYLESDGWSINKAKTGNGERTQSWTLDRASDRVVVSRKNGMWMWMRRGANGGEGNAGTVIDYVQHVQRVGGRGVSLRHVANLLGQKPDGESVEPRQVRLAPEKPAHDFPRIRSRWGSMKEGANAWLIEKRGIAREVLERFAADVKSESGDRNSNKGGAVFAHRNEVGEVTGWSRKGPKHHPSDERSFSMSATDAPKLLTRMGDRENPRVIYVGESAIDLLSVYQLDKMPSRALLVSLDGNPGPEAWEELGKMAAKYPGARIGLHFDNDQPKPKLFPHSGLFLDEGAGTKFATKAEEAIRAHAPEAAIVHRAPPADYKDWNDFLRGITRAHAEANHDEILQRYSGPDASPEDRSRAQDQLDKQAYDREVRRLWDAQEGGFLVADQVAAGCKLLLDEEAATRAAKQAREQLENEKRVARAQRDQPRQDMEHRLHQARLDGSLSLAEIAGQRADFDRAEDNRRSVEEAKEQRVREKEEEQARLREALRKSEAQTPGPRSSRSI